ncbi:MAG: ferrous iron transporter B [Candidatus Thermoplasmatota archaeon]|nr:ferrous iron transporter B [Candidatus Thermoplasmatota archaeon]
MKKILLMGNPNVGKSVIFSRLTGANVIISNYPGTTVDFSKGMMRFEGERVEVIDVPGCFSLKPTTKAEEVAVKMYNEGDLVINIIDATNLERSLFLTLELLEGSLPVVIALNLWDEAKHIGINIDANKLEKLLGVPVVPTVGITGEGIKELVSRLSEAKSSMIKPTSDEGRWIEIGYIVKEVEKVEHRHHTLAEKLSDISIKPRTGIPLAFLIIFISFWIVRFIGENLITYVFDPIFELHKPVAMQLSDWLGGSGLLHDVLIGKLIDGEIEYVESMGLLTTGLFVPFGMVLPYIIAFYLMLGILEDTGYLPRLATLTDNVFHKLGMHGYGIVPVFLGLGCNVPGALSARVLETRKQRFIAATLMGIAVPCMAQIAMVFGILGSYGLQYIIIVFSTLIIIYIMGGLIINKFVKGESPEIFVDIPPYRVPNVKAVAKKLWMRVRWFLTSAIPWLFLGVVLVNVLYVIGFLGWLGSIFAPVIEGVLGLPKEASVALLIGFLRKDLAVGMLLPLGMAPMQLVIASTILTIYFPCVATFVILINELGLKDMLKSTGIMIVTALIVGGVMRLILIGI